MKLRDATATDLPGTSRNRPLDPTLTAFLSGRQVGYMFVAEIGEGETRRQLISELKRHAKPLGYAIKSLKGKGDPVIRLEALVESQRMPRKPRKPKTETA